MVPQLPFANRAAIIAISTFPLFSTAQGDSSSSSSASATVIAALGTIVGYIGSEVVDEEIFERLLWPERFYNNASPLNLLKMAVFFPMGGPLHSAAIHALMSFRKNNLHRGILQGNMLGTPFYADLDTKYIARSDIKESNIEKEGRNALLIRILLLVEPPPAAITSLLPPADTESKTETIRTIAYVHHLQIRYANEQDLNNMNHVAITESFSWKTIAGLICSEISAIIVASVVGFRLGSWFGFWWCAPLFLKIVAAMFRVRRQPLFKPDKNDEGPSTCKFEVVGKDRLFFVIEGPDAIVRQFFRHYGHPARDTRGVIIPDRMNEVVSMIVIVLYGTIFPVGLLAVTLWLTIDVQFVWLGYQLYTSLAMLVCRLFAGSSWGTTEECIAKALAKEKQVVFEEQIVLRLESTHAGKVDMARSKVRDLLEGKVV